MVKISDVWEQNQEEKDSIFIHIENKKKDKYDPMIDIAWEGYLKDIPKKYMDCEVLSTGESLKDKEDGINGFYLEIEGEKVKEINNTKDYYVIAGVNGSGKSSLYALSREPFPGNWINSDNIVRKIGGMEGWKDVKIQIAAGKQAIRDIDKNIEEGKTFVQETTLCGKSIFKKINSAKENGYNIHLYYVGIESSELAKDRVKLRMINGGHGIPDKDIERRYDESLRNFKENINLFNDIHVYSNTSNMKLIFTVENNKFKIHEASAESWCTDLMNTCLQKQEKEKLQSRFTLGRSKVASKQNEFQR